MAPTRRLSAMGVRRGVGVRQGRAWRPAWAAAGLALALALAAAPRADDRPAAAAPTATPTADLVAALVRKLDADLPAARAEAQAALAAFGPAALPLLPAPDAAGLSNEQRRRLQTVRGQLWHARVAADLAGSKATLPAGRRPLSEWLRDLERQTGNPIKDMREEFQQEALDPVVAWDGKPRLFWEAFDELCKAGNVRAAHLAGEDAALLQGNGAVAERAARCGAFKFVLQGVALERSFLGDTPAEAARQGVVRLVAVFEPKFRVLQVEADTADFKLLDDRGREVKPVRQQKFTFGVQEGAHHFDMSLQIEPPDRSAQAIKKLAGKIMVTVPAATATVEFPDWHAAAPAARGAAGMTVAVRDAKDEGDELWSFTVVVKGPPPAGADAPDDSYLAAAAEQQVWLQAADGTRVTPNAGKNAAETDEGAVTEYIVQSAPGKLADYKLVVRLPAGLARVPVAFELGDIELP